MYIECVESFLNLELCHSYMEYLTNRHNVFWKRASQCWLCGKLSCVTASVFLRKEIKLAYSILLFMILLYINFDSFLVVHWIINFPLIFPRVACELMNQGIDPSFGHIHRLCCSQLPAVANGRHAHPTPVYPEEQRRLAPRSLSVQPQSRRRELHTGCPPTGPNQWGSAYTSGWTALAEVHHLLWERLWWV